MKILFVIASLFYGVGALAQQDIEMNIGDFDEIKVYDLINVELIQDEENKAFITGDNTNDVEILNKNGTLKIKMRLGQNFEGNKTVVTLHYKTLEVIDGNEGSYISSEELLKQPTIELRAQEGSIIKLSLDVEESKVKAVTGGEIQLTGNVLKQDISLNTGGIFQGKDLTSESTYVAVKAGGEASINASELADIKIRAGGDVYIYGNPKRVNENKLLGGRIQHMKSKP